MKILKIFADLSMARLAIVAVFVTAGYFFMYYDNGEKLETQIAGVKGQLDAEKAKRVEIEKRMKKEEEMRGNLLQLARTLDIVKSKIPNEFNEIEVSSIVNRASSASQVKISNLKRNTSVSVETSSVGAKKTGAELVEEVKFDIEMAGSFNHIIQFVDVLSKEEKTIKIRNFTIEKTANNNLEDANVRFRGEIVGFKQVVTQKAAVSK
jgi:Tfp pilus assembly protein PilO